jgi:hypothetical protein
MFLHSVQDHPAENAVFGGLRIAFHDVFPRRRSVAPTLVCERGGRDLRKPFGCMVVNVAREANLAALGRG